MAIILRANGKREDIIPKGENETLTLEQMQEVVGYVEVIKVPYSQNVMLIDEEGLLNKKPINEQASKLAQRPIVGDVILCIQSGENFQ